MTRYILLLLLTFCFWNAGGQFYEYGQDPASLKWRYIESDNFKVIHPFGYEENARHVLTILDRYYLENSAQLNHKPVKVPVILHTNTVRSNGFVMWAPKRMEFFMYPDVNPISQDWYTHLALHEFRHVVQVDKLDQGLTRWLTLLLGQQGIGPAAGMMGFWFIEGDAVYAETSLSESGRGRSPEFEMKIKAQILTDEKPHSFSKAYLGSYKDYVPDYYSYGYQMVSYGRMRYGQDFWSEALEKIGRKPYLVDPMYFHIKKETGEGKGGLYDNTMEFLKKHWRQEAGERKIEPVPAVNSTKHKFYTSYRSPEIMPDSGIVAIQSGFDILDRFVKIYPDGSEKKLHTPGYLNSGRIDVQNEKIVWDEYIPGIRWNNQSFSDLKIYDIKKKRVKRLSYHKRYSAPSFSSSGDTIVAVETDLNNNFFLVFLAADGKYLNRVPSPGNLQLQDPEWIDGTDRIVVISLGQEGKKLWTYDRNSDKWLEIFNSGYINISSPESYKDYILFQGTFTGINDIYALDTRNTQLYRVSHSCFGSFQPSVAKDDEIAWSFYTDNGYSIGRKSLRLEETGAFDIPEVITEQPFFSYGDTVLDPGTEIKEDENDIYRSGKFRKASRLFRLHSWAPYWFDYTDPELGHVEVGFPGVTLLSQNLLSTMVSYAGYEYTGGDHYLHAGITYKGWFPVFDFSTTWGGPPVVNAYPDRPVTVEGKNLRFSINSYIPLRVVAGKWIYGMQPSLRFAYNRNYFYYNTTRSYRSGMIYTEPRLYSYFYQRRTFLDLQPRWGMTADLRMVSAPFEDEQLGNAWSVKGRLYLPGIMRNHGIRLRVEYQDQDPGRYLFSNQVTFPRGYDPLTSRTLLRLTGDYIFPVLYPDLDIFSLLYLKRIRAAFFIDYLEGDDMYMPVDGKYENMDGSFRSQGLEVVFDYHPLRLLLPLSTGIRINYLSDRNEFVFDAIFSVDLGF